MANNKKKPTIEWETVINQAIVDLINRNNIVINC